MSDCTHLFSIATNRQQTALKSLITLHRLMRETEPALLDELVKYRYVQDSGTAVHVLLLYAGGTPAVREIEKALHSTAVCRTCVHGSRDGPEALVMLATAAPPTSPVLSALRPEMPAPPAPAPALHLPCSEAQSHTTHGAAGATHGAAGAPAAVAVRPRFFNTDNFIDK